MMNRMFVRPLPVRIRRACTVVGALLVVLILGGCSGSGYHYVQDTGTQTFFRVPGSWHLYDKQALFPDQSQDPLAQQSQADPTRFAVGFDANPNASIDHLSDPAASYPQGVALVYAFSPQERDSFSLSSIRNSVFPIDQLYSQDPNSVNLISSEDIVQGGFRGTHLVFDVNQNGSTVAVNETGLVDDKTENLYLLVIACSTQCYDKYESEISQVADSWTVREPAV
jgi:hypothetical protein